VAQLYPQALGSLFLTASVILGISVYRRGTDHTENLFHSCSDVSQRNCLATNRNIRYNNGLPIVVMQYEGKVFTKLLPSNSLIESVTISSENK
jgi:hypothetical protein